MQEPRTGVIRRESDDGGIAFQPGRDRVPSHRIDKVGSFRTGGLDHVEVVLQSGVEDEVNTRDTAGEKRENANVRRANGTDAV